MFDELKIDLEIEESKKIGDAIERVMLSNPPSLRKGVFNTLSTLSFEYNVGMISDTGITPGKIIRKILKDYNIFNFFNVTVFSDETGFYKPHPIVFKTALNHLGCSPRNAIHVGDLLDTDIRGALDYQMHAVWIRDPQTQNPSNIVPDYEITEIPEILDVVNKSNLKGLNL
jgi:FMN phosphatase YigB (HAD superfamily)